MTDIEYSSNDTLFLSATNAPSKIVTTIYCGNIYIHIYIVVYRHTPIYIYIFHIYLPS